MSRVAFVLIRAAPGREPRVLEALRQVDRISEVHLLFGEYDFIARIEVADTEEITRVIVADIRSLPDVVDTEALITVPGLAGPRAPAALETHGLPSPTPWATRRSVGHRLGR